MSLSLRLRTGFAQNKGDSRGKNAPGLQNSDIHSEDIFTN